MMQIDLWADITCPWCYLGVRHLRQALSQFEHAKKCTVNLHAFFLDPALDSVWEKSHAHYMTNVHELEYDEVKASYQRLTQLGNKEGIVFDFDRLVVAPPTFAYSALYAAREEDLLTDSLTGSDTRQLKLYEAIARAHFELGANIANPEVLIGCAQDIGLNPREVLNTIEDDSYVSQSLAEYQVALTMGITAVPTLLIDQQYIIPGMQTVTALTNILSTAWNADHKGAQR